MIDSVIYGSPFREPFAHTVSVALRLKIVNAFSHIVIICIYLFLVLQMAFLELD